MPIVDTAMRKFNEWIEHRNYYYDEDNGFEDYGQMLEGSRTVSLELEEGFTEIPVGVIWQGKNMNMIPKSIMSFDNTYLKKVILPEGITSIPYRCFSNCVALEEVIIPSTVTVIGDWGFYYCSNLITIGGIPNTLTSIGREAFAQCSSLKDDIIMPDTVTYLGSQAFGGCVLIKNVTISKNLDSIESAAFSSCRGIKNIVIPEGVTSIRDAAFAWCTSLESVTVAETVTSIGQQAFDGCTNLKTINLPGGITDLGDYMFDGCIELEVTINSVIPPQMNNAGSDENSSFTPVKAIYVPAESVDTYKNTYPWSNWSDKIQPIS